MTLTQIKKMHPMFLNLTPPVNHRHLKKSLPPPTMATWKWVVHVIKTKVDVAAQAVVNAVSICSALNAVGGAEVFIKNNKNISVL